MNSWKTYILVGFIVLALVVVLGFVLYRAYNSSSDNTGGPEVCDNSDIPLAPSTLEYNRSLCPTRRNCNISCSSAVAGKKKPKKDPFGESYYSIPDDLEYKL